MVPRMMSIPRVLVITWVASSCGVLLAQSTTRVSVDSMGTPGDKYSINPSISADGRFVAFESEATNLVPDDVNPFRDIYVHDRQTGTTTMVSVDSFGVHGNSQSILATISADGRFVAFMSWSDNLVPDDDPFRHYTDVFVHDLWTGTTVCASRNSDGQMGNSPSYDPAISANGRFVTFASDANNLVPNDWGLDDIFVRDLEADETTMVSITSSGEHANGSSDFPTISGEGRLVAFVSYANNLVPGDTNGFADVFVHDRGTGTTKRVNVDSLGVQANGRTYDPVISADGRFVAFESDASNLVADDTNGARDIFVHELETGTTTRVSVNATGEQANGGSAYAAISPDGRFVGFGSGAANLVEGDTNAWGDVFVHDRQTGTTTRVSVDSGGAQANNWSGNPALSADAQSVAFESQATNLVPGDSDHYWQDIFVHDWAPGPCALPASWSNYGSGWPGTNGIPGLVATSDPVLCTTVAVSADNSSGVATGGVLFVGFSSFSFVTPWGGTLLVRPVLASNVLVPAAGFSVSAPLPCDDVLCGLAVLTQLVEMDPGASRGISFTPGLALRLGIQ